MKNRIVLGIIAALCCAVVSVVLAEPDCAAVHCVYLPSVLRAPEPTPTPVPPPLNTLVLQPNNMRSGYYRDTNTEVTNTAAAATYPDPAAALQAFEAQGREDAWFVRYSSSDYTYSDAIAVGNETYRYHTSAGATQGQVYVITQIMRDDPTYQAFALIIPGYPSINLKRTFTSNGIRLVQFYISVQVGRYVTDMQVIGRESVVSAQRASVYTQYAVFKLINTPQSTHQGAILHLSKPNSIRDALMKH